MKLDFGLICILGILFFFQPSVVTGQQMDDSCDPICFEKEFINLGKVRKGDKIPFQYRFQNTSDEKIKISFIDACSCSDVTYPKKYIAPGESGEFDVIFDSGQKDSSEIINIYFELTTIDPATKLPYYRKLEYTYDLVK